MTQELPNDLTHLTEAPWSRIAELLSGDPAQTRSDALDRMTTVLLQRFILLLRTGSRDDIASEATHFFTLLRSPFGESLKDNHLPLYTGWEVIARGLSIASRRTDRSAVNAVLRTYAKYAKPLLEYLAAASKSHPVRRTDLRKELDVSQSQMSHILRDFENTRLVLRHRSAKSKEVTISLGVEGRDYVDQHLVPPWIEILEDNIISGLAKTRTASELVSMLVEAHFPSELGAERIVRKLDFTTSDDLRTETKEKQYESSREETSNNVVNYLFFEHRINMLPEPSYFKKNLVQNLSRIYSGKKL